MKKSIVLTALFVLFAGISQAGAQNTASYDASKPIIKSTSQFSSDFTSTLYGGTKDDRFAGLIDGKNDGDADPESSQCWFTANGAKDRKLPDPDETPHYLMVDMQKGYESVVLYIRQRKDNSENVGWKYCPVEISVDGANSPDGPWDIDITVVNWKQEDVKKADTLVKALDLGKKYRYLKFNFMENFRTKYRNDYARFAYGEFPVIQIGEFQLYPGK